MPIVLRVTQLPSLAEITRVPQIVVVDQTGPTISLGPAPGIAMLVGEFLKGAFAPFEVTSNGQLVALYGGLSSIFSQDAAGVQNAGGVGLSGLRFEGNGALQLLGKTFKRLGITRVDTEAVTADAGSTRSPITITVTVAAADQDAGLTNKDIVVPAGTRFGNNAVFATATSVVASSQDVTIPKGSAVTSNQVTASVNCFIVKEVEPVVAIAAAAITDPIDTALDNVSTGTSLTDVTNAAAIWPPGTGTTLRARIDSRYPLAISATIPGGDVTSDVTSIWSARRSQAVRQALLQNAKDSSSNGRGRVAVLSADPATGSDATAAAAGITAARALTSTDNLKSDRACIAWPASKVLVTAFGGVKATLNSDGWLASILSNFANERNPGANPQGILDAIVELEDAYVITPLVKGDFANLIAAGICPLTKDRRVGWWFVNGITAVDPVIDPTRVPLKRRRMADEIQDGLADLAAPYNKEPATTERVDAFVAAMTEYLNILKSPNNPGAQRIEDFAIDAVSLNTPQLTALGIFNFGISVRLLASMDYIILTTTIGETVQIAQAA